MMPEARGSGSGSRLVNVRGSSEDYRDSLENTGGKFFLQLTITRRQNF